MVKKVYHRFFEDTSSTSPSAGLSASLSMDEASGIRPGFVYETDNGKFAFKDKEGGYHYFKTEDEAKEERDAMGLGKKEEPKKDEPAKEEPKKDDKPTPAPLDSPRPKDHIANVGKKDEPKDEPKKEPEQKKDDTTVSETPEEKQARESGNEDFVKNYVDSDHYDQDDPMFKKLSDKGVDLKVEYEEWKKRHNMYSDAHVGSGEFKDFLWELEHDYKKDRKPRRPHKEGEPVSPEEVDYNKTFAKSHKLWDGDKAALQDLEDKGVSTKDAFADWQQKWEKKYKGQWQEYNQKEKVQDFLKHMRKKYDLKDKKEYDKERWKN